MEWQPIETAPKDQTRVLLFWDGKVCEGYWNVNDGAIGVGDRANWHKPGLSRPPWYCGPSHWMPLPAPPSVPSDGQEDGNV